MAKVLSTARKFKLITGKDLFKQQQSLKKVQEDEDGDMTEFMEFLQYGMYLSLFEDNLTKAKADFAEFMETSAFDTNGKSLNALMSVWKKEIE